MKHIDIQIGAKDRFSSVLKEAIGKIRDFSKATVEETHRAVVAFKSRAESISRSLAAESEAFEKMHKSALASYETLDELNRRVDAPKAAARAQEEHNKALERYCALLERAKQREAARYAKGHFYNAFDKDTHKNLEKLHGDQGGGHGGMNAAKGEIEGVARSARRAVPALMLMSRAMGSADGAAGKMANAISGVAGMAMAFGPVGAAIAGLQAIIGATADYFVSKANKMLEKAQELGAKMTERLARTKEAKFDALVNRLSVVTKAVDNATESFDRMADAQKRMEGAAGRLVSAKDNEELADLQRQKAEDLQKVSSDEKERVGAAWNLEIAKKEAEITERSAKRRNAEETESLKLAEQRLALTEKNAEKLEAAAADAMARHDQMRDLFGETDKAYVKEFEEVAKRAKDRADAERKSAKRQKSELEAMRIDNEANATERNTALKNAQSKIVSAETAYLEAEGKLALKMQKDIAKQREDDEKKLHQQRMADIREEIAAQNERKSALSDRAASAAAEFDRAFAMFRDPSRAAEKIAEEKDYQSDLDRLHRSARRYGGKWRIDELSRLMAAGDSQGVTDTLSGWRKSSRFTPEVEAMVRASAAERTKTTVEDELRKIEGNTADLAAKLEELLVMKEA